MTVEGLVQSLKRAEFFSGWGETDLREIAAPARLVVVERGATLYLDGDPRAFIYLLCFGRLKIARLHGDGKELILDIVGPGRLLGEASILDEAPQDSTAEALERSAVWPIPKTRIEDLLRRKPALALSVVKTIGLQQKKLQTRLENLAFKKVPGRLATLLLQLGTEYGVPDQGGTLLPIRLSHEQMGGLIGASREIVCTTLSSFRRKGLIAQQGRHLVIRRHQPLEQVQ